MRYLVLAAIWIVLFGFVAGICSVFAAYVLTTIAYLDFVHEFVYYGLSVAVGVLVASMIVRRIVQLQSIPAQPASNDPS